MLYSQVLVRRSCFIMHSNPLLEDSIIEVMYVREEHIVGGLYN